MAAVVEGAAWSPALSSDEVGKLLSGALSHDCALSFVGGALGGAPLAGPDGYRRFIEAWRGAVPDVKSSAHMIAHVPPAQASVVLVAWTRSGAFSGPAPLFGVAPTGAHLALHGVTECHLRGAQITKLRVFVEACPAVLAAAVAAALAAPAAGAPAPAAGAGGA